MFLGYPFGKKGEKAYDLETGEVFVSRNVIFQEEIYPYSKKSKEEFQDSNQNNLQPPMLGIYDGHDEVECGDLRQDGQQVSQGPAQPSFTHDELGRPER